MPNQVSSKPKPWNNPVMATAQKAEVIKKVDSRRKKWEIGQEYNVNESIICAINKNKDKKPGFDGQ